MSTYEYSPTIPHTASHVVVLASTMCLLFGSVAAIGTAGAISHKLTADQAGQTMGERAERIAGGNRTEIVRRQFQEDRQRQGVLVLPFPPA